jgi:hypothetical protein
MRILVGFFVRINYAHQGPLGCALYAWNDGMASLDTLGVIH